MAEVLSQSQIDALLNSMNDGNTAEEEVKQENVTEKKYKKYDFYSPKKFTKDRLRFLKSVYDNYARIATSQVNSLFRVSSEIELISVEELRYYEFSNALSESDILSLVDVSLPDNSKNPPILVHAATPVIINLIDHMLGSVGDTIIVEDSYAYTDIEIALYERIMQYLIGAMKDVWGNYIKLGFNFSRLEKNPSMFQDIGVDETIVIIMLNITLKDVAGKLSICIPGNLLLNIFTLMDRRKHISMDEGFDDKDNRTDIIDNLKDSALEMTAELGTVQLDLDDIYNLNVGDVINLNKPQNAQIQLAVGGTPWFTGSMGVHNRNVAVKIEDRVKEELEKELEKEVLKI